LQQSRIDELILSAGLDETKAEKLRFSLLNPNLSSFSWHPEIQKGAETGRVIRFSFSGRIPNRAASFRLTANPRQRPVPWTK